MSVNESLSTSLKLSLSATLVNTLVNSLAAPQVQISPNYNLSYQDGTASGQANKVWASMGRALAGSGTEDIDMYALGAIDIGAGAGKDPLGGPFANFEMATLLIYNNPTSVGSLLIGGKGASTAWTSLFNAVNTSVLSLPPSGIALFTAQQSPAWLIANTTNYLLKMLASGGAVTYDIYAIFRST